MKAVTITKAGPPEVLQVIEYPDSEVGPTRIKIKVKAAGINFADILARKGLYPDAPKLPTVVGYEVAGEVIETGASVTEFKNGDRVTALTRFWGYSDIVVTDQAQVFHTPENLPDVKAAAIPVNYITAWQLAEMGGLGQNDTVLIHNAGGGVGLAAIDLAKKRGARILGTASTAKHDRLKQRGVDAAIDYRTSDWVKEVMKLTDNKGADLIFDPLGGSNWKKSYAALRHTGRLGFFGVSTVTESTLMGKLRYIPLMKAMPFFTPVQLMNMNKGVYGVNIGRLWKEKQKILRWMHQIIKGAREGWVDPYVDAAFTFSEAPEAHRYIEARKNFGKVVLVPDH